jgi:tetratricopeptide (TPR) repeat protein
LFRSLGEWEQALFASAKDRERAKGRSLLKLRSAIQLNRGSVLAGLGLTEAAATAYSSALESARAAFSSGYEWRSLASLGHFDDALQLLEKVPPAEYDVVRGEIMERFAPRLEQLAALDAEKGPGHRAVGYRAR